MIVYVIVFSIAVSVSGLAETLWSQRFGGELPRRASFPAVITGVLLAGVSALRWRVGTDYWAYERHFYEYAAVEFQDYSIVNEPGIRLIAKLSMAMNGDSATMFAIAAVITIGLSVRTYWRWSPSFAFSIAIYILSGAWHGSFNGVRQFIACAIILAAHRYIIERRLARWLAVVFIASLFHVSALFGLLLYLLPSRRTSVKIQLTLILVGVVGMFAMGWLIDLVEATTGDTDRWSSDYAERSINPFRVAFSFVPIALYWLLKVKKSVDERQGWFYVNALALYAASFLASSNSALVARFVLYLLPFVAIGLVYATNLQNKWERMAVRLSVIGLFAVFFYLEVSQTANLRNFQWIFERI